MNNNPITQLIGQLMIIGIAGETLDPEEKEFILENGIGGVILMGRNIKDPEKVFRLNEELSNLNKFQRDNAPLFIAIDQEGGRVARLKAPYTIWPAAAKLSQHHTTELAYQMSFAMGQELAAFGFNLDFAPCMDIFSNPQNTVIGDRSPGTNPQTVSDFSEALYKGLSDAHVIPCPKHFPGHGDTIVDSHYDLPICEHTMDRLQNFELIPFKNIIAKQAELLMCAHILFPNIDADNPVTFSKIFLKELLQKTLNYKGLIISDDLDMLALKKNYSKQMIPVKSLQAGVNLLLYCNEPESPRIAIQAIEKSLMQGELNLDFLEENYEKILQFKRKHIKPQKLSLAEAQKTILSPQHKELSQKLLSV